MPSPIEVATQMIARINAGFQNEHHWMNWLSVNKATIAALPVALRGQVMRAYENASTPEVSQRSR